MTNTTPNLAELASTIIQLAQVLATTESTPREAPSSRPQPEQVLLTVEEAGELLKIGKTKMYSLVKSNAIESVLIGRLRRIHIDSVRAYAAQLVVEYKSNQQSAA